MLLFIPPAVRDSVSYNIKAELQAGCKTQQNQNLNLQRMKL